MAHKNAPRHTPVLKQGTGRSFGRLAMRMTLAEQDALIDTMRPHMVQVTPGTPTDLAAAFGSDTVGPMVLELGAGKGDQIVHRAQHNPHTRFVACEVFLNGLKRMYDGICAHKLANLKLCADDARVLLETLPENSLDEALILYPDPWPKLRHRKRRIVQPETLAHLARALKPGGQLVIVSDVVDYALWIIHAVYTEGSFFPTATSPAQWATPPQGWHPTGYEQKAAREGRTPFYFVLRHKADIKPQNHNKAQND